MFSRHGSTTVHGSIHMKTIAAFKELMLRQCIGRSQTHCPYGDESQNTTVLMTSMSVIHLYIAHITMIISAALHALYTYIANSCIISRRLKLSLLSTGSWRLSSRVPSCRASNRKGPTTKSTQPVTWYSQIVLTC